MTKKARPNRAALWLITVGPLCAALSLSGCYTQASPVPTTASSTAESPPTATVAPTATPRPDWQPQGDGTLTVGLLVPRSGDNLYLGPGQIAAAKLAVRDLNKSGGFDGADVELVVADSGSDASGALLSSFDTLVAKGADVVIGPDFSTQSEAVIAKAVEADVTVISPAATSPELSRWEDGGRFFRTIPSSASAAVKAAQQIEARGASTAAIVVTEDSYGADLRDAFTAAAAELGIEVTAVPLSDAQDAAAVAADPAVAEAEAVVLLTPGGEPTTTLAKALKSEGVSSSRLWLVGQNALDYYQRVPAKVLTKATGVRTGWAASQKFKDRISAVDFMVGDFRYTGETYDAVVLSALAATAVGDDSGAGIAEGLPWVTGKGQLGKAVTCKSYAACIAVLESSDEGNYVGVTGSYGFTDDGDVQVGNFGLYRYDSSGFSEFRKSSRGGDPTNLALTE